MKRLLLLICIASFISANAQNKLTPELLWKLGRVSGLGLSRDKKYVVYSVGIPDVKENKVPRKTYFIPLTGGNPVELIKLDSLIANDKISADGKYLIGSSSVKVMDVTGSDMYKDLDKSNVFIYSSLNFRHWDTWEDGRFDHVFLARMIDGKPGQTRDIMPNEPYDCPQKPTGGEEDYVWNPDSKHIVYVTKKKAGKDYALSTNTDLYEYDLEKGTTRNLTESNKGYDVAPAYSNRGILAWLQMKRDGFEADKQDLIVANGATGNNLTQSRDDLHVESFKWSDDGNDIFFTAPVNGTMQLFKVTVATKVIKQITKGDFDVNAIVGQSVNTLVVGRNDMNHANELYSMDLSNGEMKQLTHVNDIMYYSLATCKTERKFVTTTDNKQMLVWVIYPPNFDATKKYPTLLYCQGGPQSPQTQSYSFRWNFQLMASQGYIVVAPCRRGMPGFGTQWNEQISKDWGGQVMRDLLSSIDAVSKEPYVDKDRRGCVGASFGGFAVYALESMHEGRFKTFIAHDGVFDFRSMYGTTDEMWFENWEKGGAYWENNNAVAQRSFSQSPSSFVAKWKTPIMIIQGGRDYRVPIEQGLGAFKAAQMKGIKSKLLYLPDENHWVLSAQNALVWQREFYKWLDETLK